MHEIFPLATPQSVYHLISMLHQYTNQMLRNNHFWCYNYHTTCTIFYGQVKTIIHRIKN